MPAHFSFKAIGTDWKIDIYDAVSKESANKIETAIKERVEKFEARYSRFRPNSWLMKISHKIGVYELPDDALPLLSLYQDVYQATDGLVTPLIGQVLVDAGYDKDYSFTQKKELTTTPVWDEVMKYSPNSTPSTITIKKPVALDFGAFGKGYIIDIVAQLIEGFDISAYCVEAGGDMRYRGKKGIPFRVGLEDPQDITKVIGVISVKDQSIAGSAGNRRKWKKFNHIINPKTLSSPEHILAVWVVADSAMLADAMATALYFFSAEALRNRFAFDYLILNADRSVEGTLLGQPVLELF